METFTPYLNLFFYFLYFELNFFIAFLSAGDSLQMPVGDFKLFVFSQRGTLKREGFLYLEPISGFLDNGFVSSPKNSLRVL